MLVSTRQPQHLSDPTLSLDDTGDGRPSAEIIRMMHKLSDRATYAQQCCSCIITCFKIAITLKVPYSAVITSEPFDVLTQLLGNRQVQDRYSLSWKFIDTCNLEPKEVAGYLSECIKASLHSYHGGDYYGSPKACIYNPQMSSSQFMELVQLCSDHTVLGNHLLTMAKSISTTEQHLSATNLAIQVELLVRAHDCYTLGCCVDGIAEVLLVTRKWASTLIKGRHFKLMVRLLTGIGRFHEMSYIIGLLLECDEFESLVHAGVEKEEQLRVALMNYLLKQQPPDHEKTQMVALKFGMFRELAQAREDQAKRDLHKIRPKALAANNPDTVKTLKNVFDAFRTAAKTYSQEDCLANAEHCYSQARLVALQLSVLQSGKQVINLDVKKVHRYMEEQPFSEALIVADAYKQCIWTDWVNPLYRKVVVGGDFRYLHDFKSAFPLTPTLFQQLASKFLHDRERPPDATANMRKLLTAHLKNLPLRRRLAAELGMTDVLQTLSSSFNEGFLNDVARL